MDKFFAGISVLALIVSGFIFLNQSGATGGTTNFDTVELGEGLKVGSSGSTVTQLLKGTCNLIGAASIAATSTGVMDCAVTGVVVGDTVFVRSATTTSATGGMWGWDIAGANASSTSGFITVKLRNMTGVAGIPPITATSGIQYLILR